MTQEEKDSTDFQEINFYPPGMSAFLLATLCMLATHTCLLLSIYSLFVRPIPNHEESAGFIMAVGAISVFLVIHPSFLLSRGKQKSLRFLRALSKIYLSVLFIVLLWGIYVSGPVTYVASIGMVTAATSILVYRSRKMNAFCEHYVRLWNLTKQ